MSKKLKILHLEDLLSDALLIGKALAKGDIYFERKIVDTKLAYINALEEFCPDIILADHSLPAFNSHEALIILRQTGKKIPFILVTGAMSEDFAVDVIKKGADDYILKDRLERLPTAINNALEKCNLEKERQVALNELVKNEKHFRALIENISDAIVLINENAEVVYQSPSLKRLTGFDPEYLEKKKVADYVHPDDLQVCLSLFEGVRTKPFAFASSQYRILHKTGCYITVEVSVTNLLHDETVKAFVVCCRNITERKQAEEKLRHANWLYSFISQINQTIVHAHNEQTVFCEACNIAVEYGKFKAAWIGGFDSTNYNISIISGAGIIPSDIPLFTGMPLKEAGPQRTVLFTGNSYVCNNMQNDLELAEWKQFLQTRGYESCMILPIKRSGRVVATFNLYAPEVDFFQLDEIALLKEATKDISFALDIFENEKLKLEADAKLKDNELRLKNAQAVAHIGSWELNFSTDLAVWSEEALRIHGLPLGDFVQSHQTWASFIHPDDIECVAEAFKVAHTELRNAAFFYRLVRKDGTVRRIYLQAQLEHKDGKPVGMYGVEHDVTEIKAAEEALRQSEENLRVIIDIIPQAIHARDYNGRFVFANKNFARLYGLTPEQFLDKMVTDTIPGRNMPAASVIQEDREIIDSGNTITIPELTFTDSSGQLRVFHTIKVPYIIPGKREKAVLSIGYDIALQKQAEQERAKMTADIVKRNKDLEQFSFIVSHNLRAPVANIMGITDLLQVINPAGEDATALVRGLSTSAQKIDGVIKDLNYALQVKHQVNENKELVKFSALLEDIKLSIGNLLSNEDVEITSNFTAVDEIPTTKSYLYSIFFNLISNSIKYRRAEIKPLIQITSFKKDNCIVLTFTDNGLGIDLEKKGGEVFGLYKRFHFHTEGKGMGLYMVKTQVETLGGKITVESAVNKGTTFCISFDCS